MIATFLVICLCISFAVWQTNGIEVTEFTYSNPKIPQAFDGFKIVHLSDIHSKSFGKDQTRLIKLIENEKPDLIVITGDLIDERTRNLDSIQALFAKASEIAPVCCVFGNHDTVSTLCRSLKTLADETGVIFLDNEYITLTLGSASIKLAGISDPESFGGTASYENSLEIILRQTVDGFTILLSHRPEKINLYEKYGADLCFAGHAHGGQIALPLIGPIYAPNQGFFPKYSSGMYQSGDTTMLVSRGLGTTAIPVRLFARPQIICVTLAVSR